MNLVLPLLASVKFPNDIDACLDVFKEHLALALQIVRSASIAILVEKVPELYEYFKLPASGDEDLKRTHEIVRLIVFGLIGDVEIDELADVYANMCTSNNIVTLSAVSRDYTSEFNLTALILGLTMTCHRCGFFKMDFYAEFSKHEKMCTGKYNILSLRLFCEAIE